MRTCLEEYGISKGQTVTDTMDFWYFTRSNTVQYSAAMYCCWYCMEPHIVPAVGFESESVMSWS